MTRTRTVLVATAAAAVLAAGGTAYAVTGAPALAAPAAPSPSSSAPAAPAAAALTVDQVIETALKTTPGRLESADLEDDGTWEATVLGDDGRRHELTVTAPGTATARHDNDDRTDDADDKAEDAADARALRANSLTAADAVTKARAAAPGTITAVELDDDSAWTVEINDRDHTVDPTTGRVTLDKDDD